MVYNKNLYVHIIIYLKNFNTFWTFAYKNSVLFLETQTNHANMTVSSTIL